MKLGRDEVLMALHMCLGISPDQPRGGSKAGQEGVKESFKEKKPLLGMLSYSGSGLGRIFQGMDPGQGKNR